MTTMSLIVVLFIGKQDDDEQGSPAHEKADSGRRVAVPAMKNISETVIPDIFVTVEVQ